MPSGTYERTPKQLPDGDYPGEIRSAAALGYVGYAKFIWHLCPKCGEARWLQHTKWRVRPDMPCRKCSHVDRPTGKASPHWKGGRHISAHGYVQIRVERSDPLHVMARRSGYAPEHRIVLARALGRPLTQDEIVHHKDANPLNNALDNLELMPSRQAHMTKRHHPGLIARLEAKIIELEAELARLKNPQ